MWKLKCNGRLKYTKVLVNIVSTETLQAGRIIIVLVSGYFKMQINQIHLMLNKPLLELSCVVNSTAPTEEIAARIKLATMTFFRPNLKFKIKPTSTVSLCETVED